MALDLRSDTVTRPTPAMQKAMWAAPTGDDVFGEDPSINELQEKAAKLFGMEAALFCPSGTMTNQVAINVHTVPGQEIICHQLSHVYIYEGGGIAFNSGCQVRLAGGARGLMNAAEVESLIQNPEDIHAAPSRLVVAENTTNKGGGACYEIEDLQAIRQVCDKHGLSFHLDGARLWNALVAKNQDPKDYGRIFHSISICLSKGLGCPVGSLLLGSHDFIKKARRVRKRFGGGMRQAGSLAAAGIYALDNHIDRLSEDHKKAQQLSAALEECSWVEKVVPVETNIVIFYLKPEKSVAEFTQKLAQEEVLFVSMGQGKLRFVPHIDTSEKDIANFAAFLKAL
jgi:threonine aldolase